MSQRVRVRLESVIYFCFLSRLDGFIQQICVMVGPFRILETTLIVTKDSLTRLHYIYPKENNHEKMKAFKIASVFVAVACANVYAQEDVENRVLQSKSSKAATIKSTKAPTIKSTKAPTIKSTKAPTIKSAKAPTIKSSKASTTKASKSSASKSSASKSSSSRRM